MDLRTVLYEICIPGIVLLCFVAAIFNLAVFASRFTVRQRTASLELIYSLALSDTWTSIVVSLSLFWNSYKPVVLLIPHKTYCFPLTLEAFRTGGLLTGVFHLAALALVHLLQIERPFDHAQYLSLRLAHCLIAVMWVLPTLSLIAYFSMWPTQGYRNETCANLAFYESLWFRGQVSIIITVLLIITVILYSRMLIRINKVRAKTAATTRGRRTVITAALIIGTFLFGWMPACLMYILTAEGMPLFHSRSVLINVLSIVVLINIIVKTMTNPIIYATRIPEIRQFVLQKIIWKLSPPSREKLCKSRLGCSDREASAALHKYEQKTIRPDSQGSLERHPSRHESHSDEEEQSQIIL